MVWDVGQQSHLMRWICHGRSWLHTFPCCRRLPDHNPVILPAFLRGYEKLFFMFLQSLYPVFLSECLRFAGFLAKPHELQRQSWSSVPGSSPCVVRCQTPVQIGGGPAIQAVVGTSEDIYEPGHNLFAFSDSSE